MEHTNELSKFINIPITIEVEDTNAAIAAKYGPFFIAPWPCVVIEGREVHSTAGTDTGAVTLTVEKLTGTQAKGTGVNCLSSTFNLKGTANTVTRLTPTTTIANWQLVKGNRLGLLTSGTLITVNQVVVTVLLKININEFLT